MQEQEAYDFQGLAQTLMARAEALIQEWLPGGKTRGKEYVAGSLRGGPGDSLSVNTQTGLWADFATDARGGDLISLYAAVHGLDQGQAYRDLLERYGYARVLPMPIRSKRQPSAEASPSKPPPHVGAHDCAHHVYGKPARTWAYRDSDGSLMHMIARYNTPDGKQVIPWSFIAGRWTMKAYPEPRPLFNLDLLAKNQQKPVLVCEGEPACEAAQAMCDGRYIVTTWSGGAQALSKADLSPLHGRELLLWPDADPAGVQAMQRLAEKLSPHCKLIKVLDVSDVTEKGFDAADLADKTWEGLLAFAKPRARIFQAKRPEVLPPEAPPTEEAPFPEEPPPAMSDSNIDAIEGMGLITNTRGVPYDSELNLVKILSGCPQFSNTIWYDEFHAKIFTTIGGKDKPPREWSDKDTLSLLLFIQQNFAMPTVTPEKIDRAINAFATSHIRNEPKDWMETLTWDGTDRIDTFFPRYFGSEENLYTITVSANFWISMIARIFRPGVKVDNMVVLISNQGTRKSTAIEAIGGKWYSSVTENPTSKDFYLAIQGKMLIELEELKTLKNQDAESIKAMLSRATDRIRLPYGRRAEDFPRRNIFIGTTNRMEFLTDDTGNRRFWPVQTGQFQIDQIRQDRDQLFAEAVAKFKEGSKWWEVPPAAEEIQDVHRRHDEWEDIISQWCDSYNETTVKDVACDLLKIDPGDLDIMRQKRIARILSRIGYKKSVLWRYGRAVRKWVR